VQDTWSANQHVPAILAGAEPPVTSESGYVTMAELTKRPTTSGIADLLGAKTPGSVTWLNKLIAALPKKARPEPPIDPR
jgi:hypothetical protein